MKKVEKNRYKIGIINFNLKRSDFKINSYPKFDTLNLNSNKRYMFETQYSNFNEKAMIEIDFNETLVDYSIDLEFEILVTDKSQSQINNTVIIFDEQNRELHFK